MNAIVILADTLRRDHLGVYGTSPVKTPNIDRFARQAMVFENCYISSYPCMPARQDLWTGQLSFLRRGWSPLEYDTPDFPTLLGESGVCTGLITDHYHYWQYGAGNYHQAFTTCEFIRGQENDNYRTGDPQDVSYPAEPRKLNPKWPRYYFNTAERKGTDDYFTAKVFSKAQDWLSSCQEGRPFTLVLDCFDPHEPFDPPIEFAEPYLPKDYQKLPIWPKYGEASQYTPQELEIIHGLYCGEVAFFDHCFGKLYDFLAQFGLLKDTAVILTSDHGWLFGEHDWLGKHSSLLYDEIVHTPLIIGHPSVKPGCSGQLVQMADLMPTILDIMGVSHPSGIQGKSLMPLWQSEKAVPQGIMYRKGLLFGVFGGEAYVTDGVFVFSKSPGPGNSPLYWYTRSNFNNWDFGQVNYWQDSIKRLDQYDGRRFPVQYANAHPRHAAPEYAGKGQERAERVDKQDALYCLRTDPRQEHNLIEREPELVEHYRGLMKELLLDYSAPPEMFHRLELT